MRCHMASHADSTPAKPDPKAAPARRLLPTTVASRVASHETGSFGRLRDESIHSATSVRVATRNSFAHARAPDHAVIAGRNREFGRPAVRMADPARRLSITDHDSPPLSRASHPAVNITPLHARAARGRVTGVNNTPLQSSSTDDDRSSGVRSKASGGVCRERTAPRRRARGDTSLPRS
jgi:hypothetical protein